MQKTLEPGKSFGTKVKEAFTPNVVRIWARYRRDKKEIMRQAEGPLAMAAQVRKAKREAVSQTLLSFAKVFGSAALYQGCAATYGVDARDYSMSFNAQEAWGNTSRLSVRAAAWAASFIPPSKKIWAAAMIIPAEFTLSAIRIYVEQKVWKKYGITPDPAGTLLTPYMAGVLEFGYKFSVAYPEDDNSRIGVGLVGIYGNLVRMANAALIYAAGRLIARNQKGLPEKAE